MDSGISAAGPKAASLLLLIGVPASRASCPTYLMNLDNAMRRDKRPHVAACIGSDIATSRQRSLWDKARKSNSALLQDNMVLLHMVQVA